MSRKFIVPDLFGARAVILHREHPTVTALSRQLRAIGLLVDTCWPDLGAGAESADYVFFDVDSGHDGQFPWTPGQAPMPMIALIGSEAPGRLEWALSQGAAAQIMKPVGDGGVFSALLLARQMFDARVQQSAETTALRDRVAARQTIVQAVMMLANAEREGAHAFDQLRQLAMAWRVTIEDAAARVVAGGSGAARPLIRSLGASGARIR